MATTASTVSETTATSIPTTSTTTENDSILAKRKQQNQAETGLQQQQFISRNPPWTYLKLQLIPQPGTTTTTITPVPVSLDPISARTYLTSALTQFLGLTGSAIPIDILKIDVGSSSSSLDTGRAAPATATVWIRVPRDDAAAVVSALSSWIGTGSGAGIGGTGGSPASGAGSVAWRIVAKGNYLNAIVAGSGEDLFNASSSSSASPT